MARASCIRPSLLPTIAYTVEMPWKVIRDRQKLEGLQARKRNTLDTICIKVTIHYMGHSKLKEWQSYWAEELSQSLGLSEQLTIRGNPRKKETTEP